MIVIYTRVWYYISGEFTVAREGTAAHMIDSIGSALKASKEVLISQTATAVVARETVGRAAKGAAESVADVLRDEL